MQVIGFNFTKISAERAQNFKHKSINTNIEFTNLEKEEVPLLKDQDAVKISFNFLVDYSSQSQEDKERKTLNKQKEKPQAQIDFDGHIVLTATKQELKDLQESWKNKKIPQATQIPLFNIILKKATPKALQLQDELNLPSHIPLPRVQAKSQSEK